MQERVSRYSAGFLVNRGARDARIEISELTGRKRRAAWLPEVSITHRSSGDVVFAYAFPKVDASFSLDVMNYVCKTREMAEAASAIMALFWLEANIDPKTSRPDR
jgi:adenylosuccinate synthase